MIPPNVIRIKIDEENGKSISLYFPAIVVYILLLPLLVLAFPFWLLAVILFISTPRGKMILLMPGAVYRLLCAAKGTDITVHDEKSDVVIKIY